MMRIIKINWMKNRFRGNIKICGKKICVIIEWCISHSIQLFDSMEGVIQSINTIVVFAISNFFFSAPTNKRAQWYSSQRDPNNQWLPLVNERWFSSFFNFLLPFFLVKHSGWTAPSFFDSRMRLKIRYETPNRTDEIYFSLFFLTPLCLFPQFKWNRVWWINRLIRNSRKKNACDQIIRINNTLTSAITHQWIKWV